MEYQKVVNMFDDETIQPSKFRTKHWVKIINDAHGTCGTNSQTKFKKLERESQGYVITVMHTY